MRKSAGFAFPGEVCYNIKTIEQAPEALLLFGAYMCFINYYNRIDLSKGFKNAPVFGRVQIGEKKREKKTVSHSAGNGSFK